MQQLSEPRARPKIRRALTIAAALLCATALGGPNLAYAGPHGGGGGGGFHGGGMGGFHGGGGGFHGGGFGGFHGHFAGMHHGFGERHDGFRDRRGVFIGGLGFGYYGYPYAWDYSPDYGYSGYSQPY